MAIGIHPLTASIGAEITGVDMADVSTETAEELRKAWLDHKVLVLRDQPITQEQHIAFGRRFGELEIHPFTQNDAVLSVVNARYHMLHNWDALLEWRALHTVQAGGTDIGLLGAVSRQISDGISLGVGYNFGTFSDDLTDLTRDD